jgi:hypothetical protein
MTTLELNDHDLLVFRHAITAESMHRNPARTAHSGPNRCHHMHQQSVPNKPENTPDQVMVLGKPENTPEQVGVDKPQRPTRPSGPSPLGEPWMYTPTIHPVSYRTSVSQLDIDSSYLNLTVIHI